MSLRSHEEATSFATTILTSKTPQQAALILPNSLDSTTKLVDENLINWFSHYTSALRTHNQTLQKLHEEGSKFFTEDQYFGEYGNFPRIWNCLLSSLQVEHANNEILYKSLKLDVLGPLKDVVDKDVRLSELLINSQELQEISAKLAHSNSNAEIEWNYKAPQSFTNLENFKAFEIQLYFDVVLNFFQFHSTRLNKDTENNVNSTNYLLNNFKLNNELNHYLEYLVKTEFKPSGENGFVKQQQHLQKQQQQSYNTKQNKRLSSFTKPDNHSIVSEGSSGKKSSSRSKLKSRVGSIFGRKSKNSDKNAFAGETIPETESIDTSISNQPPVGVHPKPELVSHTRTSSTISRSNSVRRPDHYTAPSGTSSNYTSSNYRSSNQNFQEPPPPVAKQDYNQPPQPVAKQDFNQQVPGSRQADYGSVPSSSTSGPQSVPSPKYYTNPSSQSSAPPISSSTVPLVAQTPTRTTSGRSQQGGANLDSPNVVPFHGSDSSSDEDGPEDVGNRRLSMLQKHDLAPEEGTSLSRVQQEPQPAFPSPPVVQQQPLPAVPAKTQVPGAFNRVNTDGTTSSEAHLSLPRSRQSSGKYSFEAGDEQNVDPSPSPAQYNVFEDGSKLNQELPAPNIGEASPAGSSRNGLGAVNGASGSHAPPPPPPPSRKVVHRETDELGALQTRTSDEIPRQPRNRKDVQSQIFHNLPAARESYVSNPRESFIQPSNGFGGIGAPAALVSQDTGNSLLKHNDFFKHFDTKRAESQGLNSSIAEVVNVTFKDAKLVKAQLIGEIAFNYNDKDSAFDPSPIALKIVNNFDKTILNNTFVQQTSPEQFRIDTSQILSKTLGGLKYLIKLNESQVPLLVQHVWKYEPHQSSLMINLRLNPAIKTQVVFTNLLISVALNADVQATSASSKPLGSFAKDKNRITWRYTQPLVLGGAVVEERLIARFITQGTASEHESGVQLKFQVQEPYVHNATIYDAEGTAEVPVVRNLISGAYSGHAA